MPDKIILGERVPRVSLGYIEDGILCSATTEEIFGSGRVLILGVPGAFTPVCTQQHVPDFVRNADQLHAAGFEALLCLAASDPFTLDAWAQTLDPDRRIRFVSDGNLDFAAALGLVRPHRDLFLGRRSERYLMVVNELKIQVFRVEDSILTVSCTASREAFNLGRR